jgi:RimJ/RimL family protein N-acetyltransferase
VIEFKPMTTEEEWNWIHDRTRCIRYGDSAGIVAYRGDEIQAVATFDTFTVNACNMGIAIMNPMVIRRGFLGEIARHLFTVCDRKRVFAYVAETNKRSLKFVEKAGARIVATIPDALDEGVGYTVFCFTEDECLWIEQNKRAA